MRPSTVVVYYYLFGTGRIKVENGNMDISYLATPFLSVSVTCASSIDLRHPCSVGGGSSSTMKSVTSAFETAQQRVAYTGSITTCQSRGDATPLSRACGRVQYLHIGCAPHDGGGKDLRLKPGPPCPDRPSTRGPRMPCAG